MAVKTLREGAYLENFQKTPHYILANLIENGNWKVDVEESRRLHPNDHYLHYTPNGEGI